MSEALEAMPLAIRLPSPLTEADLLALTRDNPGYHFERRADGKLAVSPSGFFNGLAEGELYGQMFTWNRAVGGGVVLPSSAGFTLPDDAILSPDCTYVSTERLATADADGVERAYIKVVPNAVFELVSPGDARADVQAKTRAYLANGVGLVVTIDPKANVVTLDRPGRERATYHAPTTIALDPEVPGCVLDIRAIVAAAIRR